MTTQHLDNERAMHHIAMALDGQEWDGDTLDYIAGVVRMTGRTIHEPGDKSADGSGYWPCNYCGRYGSSEDHMLDNEDGACSDCQDIYGNTKGA